MLAEAGRSLDAEPEADTVDAAGALPLLIWEALIEASSSCSIVSSSFSTWAVLKDKARLNLPFNPPLLELSRRAASCKAPRSISSRDLRFSDAVNVPCESGDGLAGRGTAELGAVLLPAVIVDVVVAIAEVVETDEVGREGEGAAPGRIDVAVDVEEVEELR